MRIGPDGAERIAAAVERAEAHTGAELVLVAQPFAGSYALAEAAFGGVCALAFLAWALFSDHAVAPVAVLPSTLLALVLGAAFCRVSPHLRRLFTLPAGRRAGLLREARLAFLEHGIDGTSGRTGVLIYCAFLERDAALIADRAVRERFAPEELAALERPFAAALRGPGDPTEGWCEALEALGRALGERLPRDEHDVDELANAPRFGERLTGGAA